MARLFCLHRLFRLGLGLNVALIIERDRLDPAALLGHLAQRAVADRLGRLAERMPLGIDAVGAFVVARLFAALAPLFPDVPACAAGDLMTRHADTHPLIIWAV